MRGTRPLDELRIATRSGYNDPDPLWCLAGKREIDNPCLSRRRGHREPRSTERRHDEPVNIRRFDHGFRAMNVAELSGPIVYVSAPTMF